MKRAMWQPDGALGRLLLSTAIGAAAAFGAPAYADEQDDMITVTGQRADNEFASPKVTVSVLNAPQTLSVIPEAVFAQQGARTLTDVLNNTPGITFNAGENGFTSGLSNFSMRGFDTSGSIFVDGSRDSGSYNRDAFNVAQVEVVKGPAGDNGRATAGGFVNVVTKTPFAEAAYAGHVSYGFDDTDADTRVRTTLDLNQPFSNTAAGRLNVLLEDGGVAGRETAQRYTLGIAPSLIVGLNAPTQFTVAAQYVQQEDRPDWGVPAALIEGMLRFDPALDAESLRDNYYGISSDFDDVTSTTALARVEHSFSPALVFSSQVRFALTDRETVYTLPTGYAAGTQLVTTQRQAYARENESLSWLNNLSAAFETGALRHRLAVGVEYSQEEASARSFPAQTNPGGAAVPITSPNPDRAGPSTLAATQRSDVRVETIAAYAFDTIEFSPQWQMTAGLRVEQYDVEIDNTTIAGAPLGPDGYEVSETLVSGRVGVVYKPIEAASLYAAVGVSPQPPGSFLSTPDISREGDNAFPGFSAGVNGRNTDVQQAINYELGGKWDLFGERLLATAALFRTERHNVAITGRSTTSTAEPITLQGYGEQIVQGLEIGLAGEINPAWTIFAGAVFMDSERVHGADLDLARCRAQPGDYGRATPALCVAGDGTNGDALAFTPEVSANLWTTYAFPFGLTIGGGVRYVGESFVGRPDDAERIIPNDPANKLPDYWVANALVEYAVTPQATVRLNVDNITDEFYAVSTNWASQRVLLGPPRSFLVSLNLRL